MGSDDEKITAKGVDEQDEMLTVENVDEQVEHHLAQVGTSLPVSATPLMRTVRNLQRLYAENRRLEQVWMRINDHVSALNPDTNAPPVALPTIQPAEVETKALTDTGSVLSHPVLRWPGKRSQPPFRWNWRTFGASLVAASILLAICVWPIVSYALGGTFAAHPPSSIEGTPQSQSTVMLSDMKEYRGQHFTIQYPSNWVITYMTAGGSSRQTVQLRPAATSAVFVNIDVLTNTRLSADQLLLMDSAVKSGTLLSTSSVTYHDLPWAVGIVKLSGAINTQASKLEVAYTNQGAPYRLEFRATADNFNAYTPVFNAMFASFHAQTTSINAPTSTATPIATPTITPTVMPGVAATPSPVILSPTTTLSGLKVYSSQYFTIQYPSSWVITSVTADGSSRQTVQLRPAATSAVSVDIDVLANTRLSADQLLLMDPDVEAGSLLNTSSVTYHGISWKSGIVNLLGSELGQSGKVEVTYAINQNTPYKIKLSAPPDMFNAYTHTFDTMLASFYPAS